MTSSVKRLAATAALVLLFGVSLPASAAYAGGSYTCTSGTRTYMGDIVGYWIFASGCTGSGSGSGPAAITITGGAYAGSYGCASHQASSLGTVSGLGC
ncbi:hypothetical protein [Sphaerisporangium sp. TRM90804]|uniref:hypothetical protein n=1 Tax=Sphaerisporangium sp. TRM90804 TaxID=3031113 RepID=UPI00244C24A6|nr:hypothetical protein [Sphaerisporangium sp. TRM90804]MDH2428381.1 hypothetical protein [Sphaerisporangium sp. TRM90804]